MVCGVNEPAAAVARDASTAADQQSEQTVGVATEAVRFTPEKNAASKELLITATPTVNNVKSPVSVVSGERKRPHQPV
jgi:hypothetical protein